MLLIWVILVKIHQDVYIIHLNFAILTWYFNRKIFFFKGRGKDGVDDHFVGQCFPNLGFLRNFGGETKNDASYKLGKSLGSDLSGTKVLVVEKYNWCKGMVNVDNYVEIKNLHTNSKKASDVESRQGLYLLRWDFNWKKNKAIFAD